MLQLYDDERLDYLLADEKMKIKKRPTAFDFSLDAVMRAMYQRFPLAREGYTTADLIAVLEELSASQWDSFFAGFISGTEEFPFESALKFVGLELAIVPEKKDDRVAQKP